MSGDLTPIAQRRPGHAPRRHVLLRVAPPLLGVRSTKAGARTPATRALVAGRELPRSTKAGARTPATPVQAARVALGTDRLARSTKAGARTPATLDERSWAKPSVGCAQRRPGHAPRRHRTEPSLTSSSKSAQRRPGHAPRRHVKLARDLSSANDAQRRPGHAPRRHMIQRPHQVIHPARSTKAGARTPATPEPAPAHSCRCARHTLNEGRGTHPGDTVFADKAAAAATLAQRRPGHAPRRHAFAAKANELLTNAQRRPGHAPRRHIRMPVRLHAIRAA